MSLTINWRDYAELEACSRCRDFVVQGLRKDLADHEIEASERELHIAGETGAGVREQVENSLRARNTAIHHRHWAVAGMDCGSCVAKIEKALQRREEVDCVDVSMMRETVMLGLQNDRPQTREDISKTLGKLGYRATEHDGRGAAQGKSACCGGCGDADATASDHDAAGDDHASYNNASHDHAHGLPHSHGGGLPLMRRFAPWPQAGDEIAWAAICLLMGWAVGAFVPVAEPYALSAGAILAALPVMKRALQLALNGALFSIEFLMSVAVIGAVAIGDPLEAGMVVLLFAIGESLEGVAAGQARNGVKSLLKLSPEKARRIASDGTRQEVHPSALAVDDSVEVRPGERIPADGVLSRGQADIDNSHLTGESVPVACEEGSEVFAGAIVTDRPIEVKVTRAAGQTMLDRVIQLVEESEKHKAPVERFVARFARIYTPIIMGMAALTVLVPPLLFGLAWQEWIYRGLALLLIGCPCALVISTPAAVTSALARAARIGLLVKGGAALETIGAVRKIAFDKTGTLTAGKPALVGIATFGAQTEDEVLAIAAALENVTSHPLARAVVSAAEERNLTLPELADGRTIAGAGVEGRVEGAYYQVGAPKRLKIDCDDAVTDWMNREEDEGSTAIAVIRDDIVIGALALRDVPREDARKGLEMLNKLGVDPVMLTGDAKRVAQRLAADLGMSYRAELLPEDKLNALKELGTDGQTDDRRTTVAMVGDGINDAPALKAADIGIAIGGGTDIALEAADAVIVKSRLTDVAVLVKLSRQARRVIRENIGLALGLKGIFLITSILGMTGLWVAVLADTGATVLVTLNSLRLLWGRKES
ncbi:heavy metal translocating P-type ATPase [Thalassospira profundimaris]|uniref:heavy metal translocating P-type ATPase n=1 Tax=Thalassospira profundimaris TaxID=502049 RepID=UPI000DEDA9CC|nr:heavy metal translocating P-type ATPase [Thalassospira profundimaris]